MGKLQGAAEVHPGGILVFLTVLKASVAARCCSSVQRENLSGWRRERQCFCTLRT